jgi:hypothetical protein
VGRDNQPKHRQKARDIRRCGPRTAPYKRVLIVCEGEKTEPLYLKEIRQEYRLSTANVQVWPSAFGTDPLNVVEHAAHLFNKGDRAKQIQPRAFDLLFAVFDRDEHLTYYQALIKARALCRRIPLNTPMPSGRTLISNSLSLVDTTTSNLLILFKPLD